MPIYFAAHFFRHNLRLVAPLAKRGDINVPELIAEHKFVE